MTRFELIFGDSLHIKVLKHILTTDDLNSNMSNLADQCKLSITYARHIVNSLLDAGVITKTRIGREKIIRVAKTPEAKALVELARKLEE